MRSHALLVGSRVLVVFNQAEAPAKLHIPLEGTGIQSGARLENLLGTTPAVEVRQGARRSIAGPLRCDLSLSGVYY